MIDIAKVVTFHFVVPDTVNDLFNAHIHGLKAFGHREFPVLVPGFCRSAAWALLSRHTDAVINRGERFLPGELGESDSLIIGYEEVPGDFRHDPTRLRIVDRGSFICGSMAIHPRLAFKPRSVPCPQTNRSSGRRRGGL